MDGVARAFRPALWRDARGSALRRAGSSVTDTDRSQMRRKVSGVDPAGLRLLRVSARPCFCPEELKKTSRTPSVQLLCEAGRLIPSFVRCRLRPISCRRVQAHCYASVSQQVRRAGLSHERRVLRDTPAVQVPQSCPLCALLRSWQPSLPSLMCSNCCLPSPGRQQEACRQTSGT